MAKVQVIKGLYEDPRVQNEDGSFGALREGYRDPDTHFIHFTDNPNKAAADESEEVAERETVEVEAEVVPQNVDSDENSNQSDEDGV